MSSLHKGPSVLVYTIIESCVEYDSASPNDWSTIVLQTFSTEALANAYASELLYLNGTEDDYCYNRSYHVTPMKVFTSIADIER
jgi:hypothetical protein